MTKEKDYYWAVTKEEFLERLKILKNPYSLTIWNYLQAYIIRGRTEIPLWKACYNLYDAIGLLATSISINRMSRDLGISSRKIIYVLDELDKNNHIIKYVSKNKNDMNNTNIYIIGFVNANIEGESSIDRQENYFVGRVKEMRPGDRKRITKLFDEQLKVTKVAKGITKELKEIQDYLFTRVVHEMHKESSE